VDTGVSANAREKLRRWIERTTLAVPDRWAKSLAAGLPASCRD
jgi:hypothetical protein